MGDERVDVIVGHIRTTNDELEKMRNTAKSAIDILSARLEETLSIESVFQGLVDSTLEHGAVLAQLEGYPAKVGATSNDTIHVFDGSGYDKHYDKLHTAVGSLTHHADRLRQWSVDAAAFYKACIAEMKAVVDWTAWAQARLSTSDRLNAFPADNSSPDVAAAASKFGEEVEREAKVAGELGDRLIRFVKSHGGADRRELDLVRLYAAWMGTMRDSLIAVSSSCQQFVSTVDAADEAT